MEPWPQLHVEPVGNSNRYSRAECACGYPFQVDPAMGTKLDDLKSVFQKHLKESHEKDSVPTFDGLDWVLAFDGRDEQGKQKLRRL